MHWASQYIGLKHKQGGRDRHGVDCWGLVRLVYLERYGIELPDFTGISIANALTIHGKVIESAREDWELVNIPFDGAAVALSQQEAIHHVGIYAAADGGKIVHCWDGHHVIADSMKGLELKGFRTIKFYRHKLWPI